MSKILGIDLGTTNSCMSIMTGDQFEILENAEGARTTPSMVAINKSGERLVGTLAKRQAVTNPKSTIFSAKRLIGRKFKDKEVQDAIKHLPYELREGNHGDVEIKMGEEWKKPMEIAAMVLQKMKADAEAKLGEDIKEAVITVPAYFNDSQRKATKDAGKVAGFEVKRIINEPTSAALAYGFNKKKDEKIIVYDFGGGTFDVSVLEVSEETVEVKATNGDTYLGGDDFDEKIVKYLIDEFKKNEGVDLSKDPLALQRLKDTAEKAKIELSSASSTDINQPFIAQSDEGPKHLNMQMTRAKLEELTNELVERTRKPCEDALKDAGIDKGDINEIILVGGMTRMPAIQNFVKDMFGKEANKTINPDEVVAGGAAIQGGVLRGDVKDVLLLDVTPLTLSIETLGGRATPMIDRNTTIPASKTQIYSTAVDSQPSVQINVLQGERPMATDNKSLGTFILDGIPPAPAGVPQIEVKFDIDANGILSVSAKDKGTGKEQSIRIEGSSGVSEEEIEKMKKEAEMHKEEDEKKKKLVDVQNQAHQSIATTEKLLNDNKDKIKDKDKKELEDKIKALKDVKDKDDVAAIEKAMEELMNISMKVGQEMYKQEGPSSATDPTKSAGDNDSSKDDDAKDDKEKTVDAEFDEKEDKKDDKKK